MTSLLKFISIDIIPNFLIHTYVVAESEIIETDQFMFFDAEFGIVGALLFFIGMKNSMPRRHKKKAPKTKTN